MSLVGKIQSLFLDREKTQPIFPITKVKAVSDDNGKGLNVLLDDKASKDFVTAKIAEAQLGGSGGEIDLSGFATKDDLSAVNDKIPTTPEQIGAHPNTWIPTVSDVGAAPAGYGLGEINGKVCYDPNAALEIGFYHLGGSSAVNVPGYFGYGTMLVERRASCICQTIKGMDGQHNLQIITRESRDAGKTWRDWEYVNPPMALGVEYRTTERYDGKVVYTKLVNVGALTAGGTTKVEVSLGKTVVKYLGNNKWGGLPMDEGTSYEIRVKKAAPTFIEVFSGTANTTAHAQVQVWYIKD